METNLPAPCQEMPGHGQLLRQVMIPSGWRLLHGAQGIGTAATGDAADGREVGTSQTAAESRPWLGRNDWEQGWQLTGKATFLKL